ncbi:MAG: metal-dependent transcriptional regulator [Sedimentisphaerales bacterium]|nr:metal-dependent transcriptional regulator [Sedimentisphaerales bacterium]
MAKPEKIELSASLEDYIEAIFNLSEESGIARSKDIAGMLKVSKSSVTGALKLLKDKGLANYEPYGHVTLTDVGRAAAAEIARKHDILKSFFEGILGIKRDIAQKAACKAEHVLGPEIMGRLLLFTEFVSGFKGRGDDLVGKFRDFCKSRTLAEGEARIMAKGDADSKAGIPLSMIGVGETVKIGRIDAGRGLNNRLAAMGLVRDTEVTVVSNNHPGPFVVSVRGAKVMLGRGMADKIMAK